MKNLTHNDLTELQDLLAIINSDIEKFMKLENKINNDDLFLTK